jgi:hypothetical protein
MPPEPGPGGDPDAFLFVGERDRSHGFLAAAELDGSGEPRIGNVRDETNFLAA